MLEKMKRVSKDMEAGEGAIKLMVILIEIPVVVVGCVALCGWIGYQTGFLAAGLFIGVFISIPLWIITGYRIIVFGDKGVK